MYHLVYKFQFLASSNADKKAFEAPVNFVTEIKIFFF